MFNKPNCFPETRCKSVCAFFAHTDYLNTNQLLLCGKNSVSSILEHTAGDSKTYQTKFYNPDATISFGYKENMGLTTWENSPGGPIRKTDVSIAKNYLNESELDNLNRIVTMYLDYAEMQANNRQTMTMQDWIAKLHAFLQFNEKDILLDAGKVTAEIAKSFAENEFEKYRVIQDRSIESDFDRLIAKNLDNKDE